MKQKYTITVADMELNILSDAAADDVNAIASLLDRRMKDILAKSPRCSKSEAAILCALSYCAERQSMQEAFKKVERDAFRAAGESEKLKKTVEQLQEELDNARRDAEMLRAVLEKAAAAQPQSEKSKLVPRAPVAPARKPVREVTQLSAFDNLPEEVSPAPTAPVPAARPAAPAEAEAPVAEAAPVAPAPTEAASAETAPAEAASAAEKKPKKNGKKDGKPKSHIGSMFDLLTFSDV